MLELDDYGAKHLLHHITRGLPVVEGWSLDVIAIRQNIHTQEYCVTAAYVRSPRVVVFKDGEYELPITIGGHGMTMKEAYDDLIRQVKDSDWEGYAWEVIQL